MLVQAPTWVSILVGCVLLVWQFAVGQIPLSVQITVFAFFLFLAGIPHGALDHLVEEETAKRDKKPFAMPLFLLKYVGTMLFYAAFWYVFPSASLLFFLLMSAWHFGETDVEKAPYTPLWSITRFIFGTFILLFLLLSHVEETTPILNRISQSNHTVLSTWGFLCTHKSVVLLVNVLLFILLFSISYTRHPIFLDKKRYARLVILLVLTAFLPLLPAFALYFGGWHALSSFHMIQIYLDPANAQPQTEKKLRSALRMWSQTLFFTALAFAFFAAGIWYWFHFLQTFDPLPLLFIFLSVITLPHLDVMRKMNKNVVLDGANPRQ